MEHLQCYFFAYFTAILQLTVIVLSKDFHLRIGKGLPMRTDHLMCHPLHKTTLTGVTPILHNSQTTTHIVFIKYPLSLNVPLFHAEPAVAL